jgi:putative hydrolase of the HAD superfamily
MENLKLAGKKAVIFDLDGTLYNEADFVKSGFMVVAQYISTKFDLTFKDVYAILISDFENGLRGKNFDVLLEKLNLSEKEVSNLVEIYRRHRPSIRLYPDAEVALKYLKDFFKLGLITDGWEVTQNNKILALKINEYFNAVIITDSLGEEYRKPSEKPFKVMTDMLGVPAEEALYIGDNPLKDFITAKKLGFFTVHVRRGDSEYDSIEVDDTCEADVRIPNLLYLREMLSQGEPHGE